MLMGAKNRIMMKMMKMTNNHGSVLGVRLDKELSNNFKGYCSSIGSNASDVLRDFIASKVSTSENNQASKVSTSENNQFERFRIIDDGPGRIRFIDDKVIFTIRHDDGSKTPIYEHTFKETIENAIKEFYQDLDKK